MANIEVGEPQYRFSFGENVDEFTVEGKKEKRDEKGGLVDGMQYYLARANDPRNIEKKIKHFGFQPCTDPDIKVPFASNAKKDGTCDGPPLIKAMGDELMLMQRPVSLAKEEQAIYRSRFSRGIETENKYRGGMGVTSGCNIKVVRGPAPESSGKYVRKGR